MHLLDTEANTAFRIFTAEGAENLARNCVSQDTLDLSGNYAEWISLFSFIDDFDRAWLQQPFELHHLGPIFTLPEWKLAKRKPSSRASHAITVCLRKGIGSRVELFDHKSFDLEPGEAVIYDVWNKHRIVGSKTQDSLYLTATCYIRTEE